MERIYGTDMAQENSAVDEQMNNIGRGQVQGDGNSKFPADDSLRKCNFLDQFLCAICCRDFLPLVIQQKAINNDLYPILLCCFCCERASNYGSIVSGVDAYEAQQLT